jgi:hypothetical protein
VTQDDGSPQAEHWHGHLEVPRPPDARRSPRTIIRAVGLAMAMGLIALGLVEVAAFLSDSSTMFGWGVAVIAGGSLLLAAGLASPLPISLDFMWGQNLFSQPEPLLAPALLVFAFGVPAIVVAAIDILTG